MFSILIPSYNNLEYLKNCINIEDLREKEGAIHAVELIRDSIVRDMILL